MKCQYVTDMGTFDQAKKKGFQYGPKKKINEIPQTH